MFKDILPVLQPIILGQLRHYLGAAGASLTTHGIMTASDVQTGVGALVTLAALILSALNKKPASAG